MPTDASAAWWRRAIIYQVYPRSFADSDGDGIGDLRGILDHLDHLEQLGIDAVWLGPVSPSPQADNGYDVADYLDVDPTFGTLADLDELIAALHDRGMRFILDVVLNHTSDRHPWFEASRSSRSDPKRDWYWWRPARPGHEPGTPGAEPTNWRAAFSGPAWSFDAATGEYYLQLFSAPQPDLNWENPEVRAALHDVLRFWVDRGVDGFRMDVINFISKDPALPDILEQPGGGLARGAPYIDGPRVHGFIAELRDEVLGDRRDIVLIGEMPLTTVDEARHYTDPANGEVDMLVHFDHMVLDHGPGGKWDPQPLDLLDLKRTFRRWQDGLAERGWNTLYLSSHDQPRHLSRFRPAPSHRAIAAKAIATMLHLQRGTPFVYQGEELGLGNAPIDTADDLLDIESRNHYLEAVASGEDPDRVLARMRPLARDTSRTPMPWDDGPHGGFTTGVPWAPIAPDHRAANAAAQRDDPASVFRHYRRLIDLRHTEDVVVHGSQTTLLAEHPHVVAYARRLDETTLIVVANLRDERGPVEPPPGGEGPASVEVLVATGRDPARLHERIETWQRHGGPIVLDPWDAFVLKRRTDGR